MVTREVTKLKLPVFWDDEYQYLRYEREEFNDADSMLYWQRKGYPGPYVGFMCDMRKTQPSWNDKFVKIFEDMGWQDVGTSYYRMDTGVILPTHQDLYARYVELFDLKGREETIWRAIVYLQDWQSGHYAEYNGNPFIQWKAGSCVLWNYDTPHMAANIGIEPRYTLQITGHIPR